MSMLAQSVYALSSPCPAQFGSMTMDQMHSMHEGMDHDMENMVEPCCGEDTCTMVMCANLILFNGPDLGPACVSLSSYDSVYIQHYASVSTYPLNRPPII